MCQDRLQGQTWPGDIRKAALNAEHIELDEEDFYQEGLGNGVRLIEKGKKSFTHHGF